MVTPFTVLISAVFFEIHVGYSVLISTLVSQLMRLTLRIEPTGVSVVFFEIRISYSILISMLVSQPTKPLRIQPTGLTLGGIFFSLTVTRVTNIIFLFLFFA